MSDKIEVVVTEHDRYRELLVERGRIRTVGDYRLGELVATGRQIWGSHRYRLDEIVVRLMVGVGDLARLTRAGEPRLADARMEWANEVKKELGNVVVSTLRWCDDLGFDVTECVTLAIEAQRKFAASGKAR